MFFDFEWLCSQFFPNLAVKYYRIAQQPNFLRSLLVLAQLYAVSAR